MVLDLDTTFLNDFLLPLWVLIRSRQLASGWVHPPDFFGILRDRAVTGELPGGSDVFQCLQGPGALVL